MKLHAARIIWQILDVHTDLTQCELLSSVPISSPPVRITNAVEATQIRFYGVLMLFQEPEEANQFPPNPTCSWIAWNSDAKSVGLIFGRA